MTYKVDVLYGGPGREAAVSKKSGMAIVAALESKGCDVRAVVCEETVDVSQLRSDAIIFNIIHGSYGEDGTLQAELEAANLCYIGCDAEHSALCMDKQRTKDRLSKEKIAVPWGICLDTAKPQDPREFKLPSLGPLVLKPRDEGSSVGLYMISNPSFLIPTIEQSIADLGSRSMLLEERIRGTEYAVSVVETSEGELEVYPPVRIQAADDSKGFDYEAKYQSIDTQYDIEEDSERCAELARIAQDAFRACGCRDFSRVDFIWGAEGPIVIEINTLPGFTKRSLMPKSAAAAGIDYADLCLVLVEAAQRRCGVQQ